MALLGEGQIPNGNGFGATEPVANATPANGSPEHDEG
jgi:hypothetical protein